MTDKAKPTPTRATAAAATTGTTTGTTRTTTTATTATTATATEAAAPFQFFDAQVGRVQRLTPSMARITFTGAGGRGLHGMATAGRDQRIKLFLPHPGQGAPVMPPTQGPDWYTAWRALDPAVRGIMRTYTVRELESGELTVDFALHGGEAPASRWALDAAPGDRVGVLAPVESENSAYDYRPPQDTDWLLLTGDESALPAIAKILESVPPGTPVRAWLELRSPADRQDLPVLPDAEVTWLVGTPTADAIRDAELPPGTPYAWIAGESATVRAVRRHLVTDRGFDRTRVKFTGYWRRGATEDQLLATNEAA
ncbi:siderophore-interacting protein [Streptomyces monticola]|uniref:Siderophore-interacting protein n=1 Tax=Streptomyces monticola TaxID=2666263 RepID=A0ABW2JMS8_9ACTN